MPIQSFNRNNWRISMHAPLENHLDIEGVRLKLGQPYDAIGEWIGQREILHQLLACWLTSLAF